MRKRQNFIASVVLAASVLGVAAVETAWAHDERDSSKFRWLAGTGMTDFGFLCSFPEPPCPDAAMASSNGDTIEITGEGTLRIHKGKHKNKHKGKHKSKHKGKHKARKRVRGGGSYRHTDAATGALVDVGTWTAIKLLSFESFGPSSILPRHWSQGRALIRILMVSQFGDRVALATLELGCRLPAPFTPAPPGTIEGVRVNVHGGLNFNMAVDPRSTLFIEL